jgi:dihydroorotate dehydrogenase
VGSVTALPYVGNPPPRATRLIADRGIIVNYGLKNEGIVTISKRLKRDISYRIPTFISVAKTNCDATTKQQAGIDDYLSTLQTIKQTDI